MNLGGRPRKKRELIDETAKEVISRSPRDIHAAKSHIKRVVRTNTRGDGKKASLLEKKDSKESKALYGFYDNERFPYIARALCAQHGFTNVQLGNVFGVSVKTIETWTFRYPEFKKSLRDGRDVFDSEKVENALLKLCLGFEYQETTTRRIKVTAKNQEGVNVKIPATEVTVNNKVLPPNAKAIGFWLCNRDRERWKMEATINAKINGKVQHAHTGVVATAALENLNKDQLLALRDMISAQSGNLKQPLTIDCQSTDHLQLDQIMSNIDMYKDDPSIVNGLQDD